ncbi:MAG: hypothetical protein ACK59Y_06295 [Betaproteobacteria bacterium]|jgi:hypothetical protein|nr:hypothetical protein [Betaproteobacteria bacterium]
MPLDGSPRFAAFRAYTYVRELTLREKQRLIAEIQQTRGLMPILMKPRNGQRWSADDRAQLRDHLGRLTRLSPYLVLVVMPGGFFVLPVFAWWLDRRRDRNRIRFEG